MTPFKTIVVDPPWAYGDALTMSKTKRGAATRARIIEGAAELMYERGVAGTPLDDIMAATGTSKSQLYHYFADKDDFIHAVIGATIQQVIEIGRAHV